MRGAFIDPGGDLPKLKGVALQAGVTIEKILLTHGHIDHCGEAGDPETVGLVGPFDRYAKLLGEDLRRAAMINVAVGEQDLLDRHPRLRFRRAQPREIAAGIGEGAAHRLCAPDQAAILLQRRHRDDGDPERRFAHGRAYRLSTPRR